MKRVKTMFVCEKDLMTQVAVLRRSKMIVENNALIILFYQANFFDTYMRDA